MNKFAMAAVLCAGLSATAAKASADVSACIAIADSSARLACYDRAAGRDASTPAVPPAAAPAAAASAPPSSAKITETSRLARRWDLDGLRAAEPFAPRPYKPVYLLPATWTDRVNQQPKSPSPDHSVFQDLDLRNIEAKYQISLKALLGDRLFGTTASLWGGYTQSSRWQVYNGAESRPFRETNYEPEVMLVWPFQTEVGGWRLRHGLVSLNHQSNGRSLPLSRSWNRIIGELAFDRGEWLVELRPWWRLREAVKDDDNPDITDFIGRAEVVIGRYWGDHALTLQLRHSLRGGQRSKGSGQLEWVFPMSGALHGYLQVFSGYGESMIDYNLSQRRIGIGVTIAGWR